MNKPIAIAALAASAVMLSALGSRENNEVDRAALAAAAVAAEDRPAADLERDARRRPAISLEISPVQPGDRVLDLSSNAGYMARLYANFVGPEGHVTAQNSPPNPDAPPQFQERQAQMAAAIDALIADRGNVDHMRAPAGMLTADDNSYDVVAITLSYHDRVNAGDAEAMNAEAFRVLKPGGRYFIVDHNAEAGSGTRDTQTMHRIDKAFVRSQVEAAGFVFESESDRMENPNDTLSGGRDDAGSSQFALTFVKPA